MDLPFPFSLTDDAARHILAQAAIANEPARLRVAIEGGGCSGMRYQFAFDPDVLDDDMELTIDGLTVACDPISAVYLQGAQLSYEDNLMGAQLTLRNPNATRTCGCGQSFSA